MDYAQALLALRSMLTAVQKTRSNLSESMGMDDNPLAQRLLADMHPWLFGPRCVLPVLAEYLATVEAGAPITGADFHHFMWVASEAPALTLIAHMWYGRDLPEPDPTWAGQVWTAETPAASPA